MTFSKHTYTLTVTAGASEYDLLVKGGSVTLDEGWSPFIQGDITCARPSAAALAALDPRTGARVQLTLTQEFSDWNGDAIARTSFVADLGVRERRDDDTGELVLTLASDEALLQDMANTNGYLPGIYPFVYNIVDAYLGYFIDAALEPGYPDTTMTEPAQALEDGDRIWDALDALTQQAGLRLHCDEARQWHLVQVRTDSTNLVRLGAGVKVVESTDTISRDDDTWADAVVVIYKWTDSAGATNVEVDKAPAFGIPTKVRVIEHAYPYPGPGAAQHVLDGSIARGRAIDTTAVSNYDARPGMQFAVTLDDGTIQSGHVAAVTWSLDDDRMTITPRDLQDTESTAWILLDPGEAWADSAPGIPWTTA